TLDVHESRRHRLRCIEVISQCIPESALSLRSSDREFWSSACRGFQAMRELTNSTDSFYGSLEPLAGEVHLFPVMRGVHEVPECRRRDASFTEILYRGDVAEALGHLGPVNLKELAVAPETREDLSGRRL